MSYRVLEICAGAGGQAVGLETAGFEHTAAVEIDSHACATLRVNRPNWNVIQGDVRELDGRAYEGCVDLLAGGVPCPPFSVAGKQLGADDERDLFPEALRLVKEIRPRAVMLENVPGFASDKFRVYRASVISKLRRLGYTVEWRVLNACDFGVPQLRPRFLLLGFRPTDARYFEWPECTTAPPTVGACLFDLMAANGWGGVDAWSQIAKGIAPTVVGGSKKHGGPDLGPTRARFQWAQLGVNGIGIADSAPSSTDSLVLVPKLTVRMVARIQGFPDSWMFEGRKTAAYRQVGNAFPPPVAEAIGRAVVAAFEGVEVRQSKQHTLFAANAIA